MTWSGHSAEESFTTPAHIKKLAEVDGATVLSPEDSGGAIFDFPGREAYGYLPREETRGLRASPGTRGRRRAA